MQGSYNINFSAGGLTIGSTSLPEATTPNPYEEPIPAAKAGTLTTRTDNDTGIVTVASGHGITTSDTVDLYDSTGQLIQKDVDVTATTSTTISIDAGVGSNLPAADAVVNVAKQVLINVTILDAAIVIWGAVVEVPGDTTSQCRMLFEDAGGDDILDETRKVSSGLIEDVANGATNSLDNSGGGIATLRVSHGNTLVAGVLKLISMEDRTP